MGIMRHPRTTQERRANGKRPGNGIDYDGYLVRIRPRRSEHALPDTYDDPWRRDWNHRSWKRHRRTQYKGR